MIPDDVVRLPAGWYPDPTGLPQLRWWDNHAWTQHTTAARQPLIVQESPLAWADDLPTRRERRERDRKDRSTSDLTPPTAQSLLELDPPSENAEPADEPAPGEDGDDEMEEQTNSEQAETEAAFEPRSATGHAGRVPRVPPLDSSGTTSAAAGGISAEAPLADPTRQSSPPTVGTPLFDQVAFATQSGPFAATASALQAPVQSGVTRNQNGAQDQNGDGMLSIPTSTAPVWIIALFPLLQLVIMLLLVTGFGTTLQLDLVVPVMLGIVYLTMLALAFGDYRTLKHSGVAKPAHWSWSLLTAPVYLFVRAMVLTRKTGRGFGPVLVWLALALLGVVSVVAVPGMLITTVPTAFSAQAEQSITADAAATGATLTVTCPATPPILVGQTFSCTGNAGPGKNYNIEVSLQRSNGWIDWRVDDWGINTLSR